MYINLVMSNSIIALLLAVPAFVISKLMTRPPLAHGLWLLVLIKLVSPPLLPFRVFDTHQADEYVATATNYVARPGIDNSIPVEQSGLADAQIKTAPHPRGLDQNIQVERGNHLPTVLFGIWGIGVIGSSSFYGVRFYGLERMLKSTVPVRGALLAESRRVADALQLRRFPEVRLIDARISPLVWGRFSGPVVILPSSLLEQFNAVERSTLLAHEFAHVRRGDHWLRWFEIVVLTVYWWNPVAWLAVRCVRETGEECCDAWVVSLFPRHCRIYGKTLLKTAEVLADRLPSSAAIASTFGGHSVKRRIEMIMIHSPSKTMSPLALTAVLFLGLATLPIFGQGADALEPVNKWTASELTNRHTRWLESTQFRATYRVREGTANSIADAFDGQPFDKVMSVATGVFHKSDTLQRISIDYGNETRIEGKVDFSRREESQVEIDEDGTSILPEGHGLLISRASHDEVTQGQKWLSYNPKWKNTNDRATLMVLSQMKRDLSTGQGRISPLNPLSRFNPKPFMGQGRAFLGKNVSVIVTTESNEQAIVKVTAREAAGGVEYTDTCTFEVWTAPKLPVIQRIHQVILENDNLFMERDIRLSEFQECEGGHVARRVVSVTKKPERDVVGVIEWVSDDLGKRSPTNVDFLIKIPPTTEILGAVNAPESGVERILDLRKLVPRKPSYVFKQVE